LDPFHVSIAKSSQKDHFLKVLKPTRPVSVFFFFVLEAISKAYLASFNCGNGGKTTHVGYNYRTMHFGNYKRWRMREDKQPLSVSYMLARETTKQFLN